MTFLWRLAFCIFLECRYWLWILVMGVLGTVRTFVSTVTNKIDGKGRVSVPAPFRQALAIQGADHFYCFRSFNQNALEAYGPSLMEKIDQRIGDLDPFSEEYDTLVRCILGGSVELSFDGEGRVKLPQSFLDHAGISNHVMFVGMGLKFQIWDPTTYEPLRSSDTEQARQGHGILGARVDVSRGAS